MWIPRLPVDAAFGHRGHLTVYPTILLLSGVFRRKSNGLGASDVTTYAASRYTKPLAGNTLHIYFHTEDVFFSSRRAAMFLVWKCSTGIAVGHISTEFTSLPTAAGSRHRAGFPWFELNVIKSKPCNTPAPDDGSLGP